MNRRHFLSTLTAAVAGSSYDPEKALWVPHKKLISIPRPRLHEFVVTHVVVVGEDTHLTIIPRGPILKPGDRFTVAGMYRR